jgi:hypothetical protein
MARMESFSLEEVVTPTVGKVFEHTELMIARQTRDRESSERVGENCRESSWREISGKSSFET